MLGFQGLDDGMTANFRHSNASFGVRQADGVGNSFDDVLLLLHPWPRTQQQLYPLKNVHITIWKITTFNREINELHGQMASRANC